MILNLDSHPPKKCLICFNESPFKMMKNAFYFTLNALFVLKIFKFLCIKSLSILRRLLKRTSVCCSKRLQCSLQQQKFKSVFLKLVNMAYNEASLIKLNKEELVTITLDYQGKFNNIMDHLTKDISDLKSDLSRLKSDFSKLEADMQVTRNVNSKLSERLVTMERRCQLANSILGGNVQKTSGIPANVTDKDLESKAQEILE